MPFLPYGSSSGTSAITSAISQFSVLQILIRVCMEIRSPFPMLVIWFVVNALGTANLSWSDSCQSVFSTAAYSWFSWSFSPFRPGANRNASSIIIYQPLYLIFWENTMYSCNSLPKTAGYTTHLASFKPTSILVVSVSCPGSFPRYIQSTRKIFSAHCGRTHSPPLRGDTDAVRKQIPIIA